MSLFDLKTQHPLRLKFFRFRPNCFPKQSTFGLESALLKWATVLSAYLGEIFS